MYGTPGDYTSGVKAAVLSLGFLEDFVCTTYLAIALWMFDKLKVRERCEQRIGAHAKLVGNIATFGASLMLFLAVMAPFTMDMLLVVSRDMRFTFGLLATLIRERKHLKDAPISNEEIWNSYVTAAAMVTAAMIFALVRTCASWADLTLWNPTHLVSSTKTANGVKYTKVELEEGTDSSTSDEALDKLSPLSGRRTDTQLTYYRILRVAIVLMGIVVVPATAVALRSACSPLVAYSALNATLNELFGHAFQPDPIEMNGIGTRLEAEKYIDEMEQYDRFSDNTLYRRTTGFQGDLAFNVTIDSDNPPNVLVIGVESFRYRDSRYLVGDEDPSNLFKGTNMTITPNFDRWAKRGVALRNIWSSIPTSRSLESLLFGQVPYNSNVDTGITGGKRNTKLSGLPQLFKDKGYRTFFTTGSSVTLDNWDVFLPTHGFDVVWDDKSIKKLAQRDMGIMRDEWDGDEHRGLNWGVHDDLSFQILGDLLVKKITQQRERMADGEKKKPLFLTHYTISSHEPYDSVPRWYTESKKPDFSPMYEGEKHEEMIKRYMELRYFTDMELGKFMDRMSKEGVLNDTVVVIVGDHGQAPEADVSNAHEESVTRVPAAIVAEGRLGDAVGLVIDDAAEQYDLLNTLADIIGLPEKGFLQNGIGRSLKRKNPFGERSIFSNDPIRKMSIVRGHQRLRYDDVSEAVMLHDIESDYHMRKDLFQGLTPEEQAEWKTLRDDGRRITAYYKKRWDDNCLLAVKCS
ncbi:hypothetical protein PRIC2_011330 [Phytophthora ramorum]